MSSSSERVKEKLDIVDFLKGYLVLQQAGKNFKANCPFHKEKTPSFMVSPERQSWHCFGCNLGGDIFSFLMRYENIEFGEALKLLAEKAGVQLQRLDAADYKFSGVLYDLNAAAKDFFKKQLETASTTKQYLKERGLNPETIEEFELGWAPNEPESLTLHFLNQGHKPDDVMRAGLAFKTERGLQMDRFRGRIMFPIHNHVGKVVGFTGRILPQLDTGTTGKYVNSPETPIFNKSKLLYGFFKSKEFVRSLGSVFLVEGQMDFLMSWQAGVKNVVACSGTALTGDHLIMLRRIADQIYLSFDSDEAGWHAGERAIDLAESADFSVKVVLLENCKDPAEAVVRGISLSEAIQHAKPAVEVYIQKYLGVGALDYRNREHLRNLRIVLGKIKRISSAVERSFWLKSLSSHTGIDEKALSDESEKLDVSVAGSQMPVEPLPQSPDKKFSRLELLAQQAFSHALTQNNFDFVGEEYLPDGYKNILYALKEGKRGHENPELDLIFNLIVLRGDALSEQEAEELSRELIKEFKKEKRQHIVASIKQAEFKGDDQVLQENLKALDELSQEG